MSPRQHSITREAELRHRIHIEGLGDPLTGRGRREKRRALARLHALLREERRRPGGPEAGA